MSLASLLWILYNMGRQANHAYMDFHSGAHIRLVDDNSIMRDWSIISMFDIHQCMISVDIFPRVPTYIIMISSMKLCG